MERAIDFVRQFEPIYNRDPEWWNVTFFFGSLLAGLVVYGVYRWERSRTWYWNNVIPFGRGRMSRRRARREYVRRDAIDKLVDYVEERVFHGEYTRAEANELYRDARKYWPVKELFPSPVLLKENIQSRLARQQNQPVPLPDKPKPKHMFDKPAKA